METINNYELKIRKVKCGQSLENPDNVAQVAAKLIGDKAQEHFIVLATNTRNEVIGYWVAAVGSISSCPVDMRSVFRMAMVVGATSICCAHCHPSGYLDPSREDIAVTAKIKDAAKVLDLIFLDHVIVSGSEYYSMRSHRPEVFA